MILHRAILYSQVYVCVLYSTFFLEYKSVKIITMVNREIKSPKTCVKEEKEEIDGENVRIRKWHPRRQIFL